MIRLLFLVNKGNCFCFIQGPRKGSQASQFVNNQQLLSRSRAAVAREQGNEMAESLRAEQRA